MTSTCDKKPEPYICKLTKAQKKIVEKEFFETDEIRGKWIEELRQSVIHNHAIEWCRQDAIFLLRFLRYTKFARWCEAPVLAQEALERYLAMRHIYPEWCRGLDPRGEVMQKMINDEVFTTLGTDSAGRMIVWIRLGRFDAINLDSVVLLRYTIMFLELMAEHEPVQIGGIKVLVDYKGTTWRLFGRFHFDILRELKRAVEKVMPIWIREVHNIELPITVEYFRTFLCDVGSELYKYKTYWHKSSADARQYFEKANWPDEYGGPCNAIKQAGYLKRWFEDKRDLLMSLDRMDIDVGLDEIRFFKPSYEMPGKPDFNVKVKTEPTTTIKSEFVKKECVKKCEEMTLVKSEYPDAANVKCEFGKNSAKENVPTSTETTKKKTGKKIVRGKKKKSVKAKVDTGLRRIKKEADEPEAKSCGCKCAQNPNGKKPWKC